MKTAVVEARGQFGKPEQRERSTLEAGTKGLALGADCEE
jgi:hypothetical protein